jgi:hypothetical protein
LVCLHRPGYGLGIYQQNQNHEQGRQNYNRRCLCGQRVEYNEFV